LRRRFSRRYGELVEMGLAANPEPKHRKRDAVERRSYNLVTAFSTHKTSILRFMNDLDCPMTNNEAERALRPSKLHRKVSGCFRSLAGAERSANVRSYLDTTRKNGVPTHAALGRRSASRTCSRGAVERNRVCVAAYGQDCREAGQADETVCDTSLS
jgi:transposase